MRLIDVDILDDVVTKLNESDDLGGGVTRNEYKLIDRVLFEFPTVRAIPISFLDKEIERCNSTGMEAEAYYLNEICRYWKNIESKKE